MPSEEEAENARLRAENAQLHADEALYLRSAEGDTEAFQCLVARYQNLLMGYFVRRIREVALAEDLAQEVFLKLWRYADRYTVRARFSTYLYSVAHNTLIDHIRRKGSRMDTVSADEGDGSLLAKAVDTGLSEPLETLAREEQLALAKDAIDRLKEAEREVVLFVLAESLSYREVADILDIPEGTVKSRLHGALAHLRNLLINTDVSGNAGGQ